MKDRVVVFGRGKYYGFKKEQLSLKYEVIGFLDNKVPEKSEEKEDGRLVLSPERWAEFSGEVKVILMSKDWYRMYIQLCDIGLSEDRILLGIMEKPCFDDFEAILFKRNIKVNTVTDGKLKIIISTNKEYIVDSYESYRSVVREIYADEYDLIRMIHDMPIEPISRFYGTERGKSIDRVYIEDFLERYHDRVHGVCMELADDTYIRRFGHDVEKSIILHVYGKGENAIKGNFETGEGLEENSLNCLICTQTLQAIYDLKNSILNIHKALKPGGCVLITVSGAAGSPISMGDYHNWGVYWRFTDMSLRRLLEEAFDPQMIEIQAYGNVKAQMAFQYGMCAEELNEEDFWVYDEKYQMVIAAIATKKGI